MGLEAKVETILIDILEAPCDACIHAKNPDFIS